MATDLGQKPGILIVDDDRAMRGYLRRCLQPLAARLGPIVEAGDGRAALAALADHPIGLVLCATAMARVDGVALAHRLRARGYARGPIPLRILLVSGRTSEDEARRAGADGLLRKPFDSRTLRREVLRLLDSPDPPSAANQEP